jgi:hypothetical protein
LIQVPLVGVVGRGLVTWPGDDRPPVETLYGRRGRAELQEDHTHFVMLEMADDDYNVSRFRFELIEAIANGPVQPKVDKTRYFVA